MSAGTVTSGIAEPRVAGIDVAQLLREIGEASAQESSVELFRLCLRAQCVLQQVLCNREPA